MIVPLKKIFLRNKNLQKNPDAQRQLSFYKQVRDSIKTKGIVNPLLCVRSEEYNDQPYKCCVGNNRFLAAQELGINEIPIKVLDQEDRHLFKEEIAKYASA